MDKICEQCKKSFRVALWNSGQRFCSKQCADKFKTGKPNLALSQKVKKVCQQCGKEYQVSPYRKDDSVYCSHSCNSKSRAGKQMGNWKGGKVELTCKYCGGVFFRYPSQTGDYCSVSCSSKAAHPKREKSILWKGGTVECTCQQCGKKFTDLPSVKRQFCSTRCHDLARQKRTKLTCRYCGKQFTERVSKADHQFCSVECYALSKTGEGNWNWQGGKSFEPYPPTFNEQFKRKVRERDNYACKMCGGHGKEVHHINYVKNDTVPENCVTLCRSCHAKTNSNRPYWIKYFSY